MVRPLCPRPMTLEAGDGRKHTPALERGVGGGRPWCPGVTEANQSEQKKPEATEGWVCRGVLWRRGGPSESECHFRNCRPRLNQLRKGSSNPR